MAVTTFTHSELQVMARMGLRADTATLANLVAGFSVPRAMQFRRDIQVGMAELRRKGSLPAIMDGLLWVTVKVEKWCRQRYIQSAAQRFRLTEPSLALPENKNRLKFKVKQEWETYAAKWNY